MEGLLSPENIKKFRTLRGIYQNSKTESLSEECRIYTEQIMPHIVDERGKVTADEKYILMDETIFNQIVEVSEKHFIESK